MTKPKYITIKLTIAILAALILGGIFFIKFQRPAFDADKVAKAETEMWQAYYTGDRTKLGLLLVSLLRTQYGLSFIEAKEAGELFASSAMKFHSNKDNYNNIVLPDLTKAYTIIKKAGKLSLDPDQASRAELAWWVARRTKGQNSVEQVGTGIDRLYAVIYGQDCPEFKKAGILRAEAAALRDSGKKNADWTQIEKLLKRSYRELEKGVEQRTP